MSALSALRAEAWDALEHIGFLRRGEKNAALFVSDYPRRRKDGGARERLKAAGFTVREGNGLYLIDLSPARYPAARAFSPVQGKTDAECLLIALARRLIAANTPPERQSADAIRRTLLLLDQGRYLQLYDHLAPLAAEALRTHGNMPSAAGVWIMEALKEEHA